MTPVEDTFVPLQQIGDPIQMTVMPLVAKLDDELFPMGTGFVIAPDGLMITAAHVLKEVHSRSVRRLDKGAQYGDHIELYALPLTIEKTDSAEATLTGGFWPIDKVHWVDNLDIGFCWLRRALRHDKPFLFPPVRLSVGLPKVGDVVTGFGYYQMAGVIAGQTPEGIIEVELSQHTAFTTGRIIEVHSPLRDNGMLHFPCFHTDARFEPGMSGGPVFNEAGHVCGVITSSMRPIEEDPRYVSYASLLWPAMGGEVEVCLDRTRGLEPVSVYELVQRGFVATDNTISQITVETNDAGLRVVSIDVPPPPTSLARG